MQIDAKTENEICDVMELVWELLNSLHDLNIPSDVINTTIFNLMTNELLQANHCLEEIQSLVVRVANEHRKHTGLPNSLLEMHNLQNYVQRRQEEHWSNSVTTEVMN